MACFKLEKIALKQQAYSAVDLGETLTGHLFMLQADQKSFLRIEKFDEITLPARIIVTNMDILNKKKQGEQEAPIGQYLTPSKVINYQLLSETEMELETETSFYSLILIS